MTHFGQSKTIGAVFENEPETLRSRVQWWYPIIYGIAVTLPMAGSEKLLKTNPTPLINSPVD